MTNQKYSMSDAMSDSLVTQQCQFAEEPEPPLRIRITVFFDGTLNNRANTQYRLDHEGTIPGKASSYGSFMNDFSNVARLSDTLTTPSAGEDHHRPHYIQGIGTLEGSKDDAMWGTAFGMSDHGVVARAEEGYDAALAYIFSLVLGRRNVDRIRVDAFGFSRGAATARHFVDLVLKKDKIGLLGEVSRCVTVGKFEIPFLGLFDTVSHYGLYMDDDTEELDLEVEFSLEQVFLPGAHSDIGGGYNNLTTDGQAETGLVLFEVTGAPNDPAMFARCDGKRRELMELGWYTERQIKVHHQEVYVGEGITLGAYSIVANRSGISNMYSFVPLHMMADKAAAKGLQFKLSEYSYAGNGLLVAIRAVIEDNKFSDQYWIAKKDTQLNALRNGYFHFSANYTKTAGIISANKPQFFSAKHEYSDSGANRLEGRRRRQIYEG